MMLIVLEGEKLLFSNRERGRIHRFDQKSENSDIKNKRNIKLQ